MDDEDKELVPIETKFLPPVSKELENDLEYVRQNMYDLIEKGAKALENVIEIADQSQHPRAYEVTATMLNSVRGLNSDLMNLAIKKHTLTAPPPEESKITNVFVGSTADMLDMLEADRERAKDITPEE